MKKHLRIVLATAAFSMVVSGIATADTNIFATYFSGPAICPYTGVTSGLACQGPYCSDLGAPCVVALPGTTSNTKWTGWYSSGDFYCDPGWVVDGFQLYGVYSPYVSLHCVQLWEAVQDENKCYWTDYFSEESPNSRTCASNYYVHGMSCSGANCDNMRIRCCKYVN